MAGKGGFRRRFGTATLRKVSGYITRKPPIYPVRTILQAVQRQTIRPRLRTRALVRRVFGAIRRPQPILVKTTVSVQRAAMRARFQRAVIRASRFGSPATARPSRYPVIVILAERRRDRRTAAKLGRTPTRPPVAPTLVHTRAVVVTAQAVKRAARFIRVRVLLGKPHGYITVRPPVRGAKVISFAARARAQRAYYRGSANLGAVVRTFAPVPPVTGGKQIIFLKESGQSAKRIDKKGRLYEEVG